MSRQRHIAFSTLIMPDGQELHREIVTFDNEGRPISHKPLNGELPFVEWRDETFIW